MPPFSIQRSAEAIWESISPSIPNFSVEILPTIDSTNSELMRRARAGNNDSVLLIAEHQTAGRGRLGREWLSEENSGALTFSIGLPLAPQNWSGLSLAVGLSIVESLDPTSQFLQLKWPNDGWLNHRKMMGILIETIAMKYVVIGVGINILPRSNIGLRTPSASLSEILSPIDAPTALLRIAEPLIHSVKQFEQYGFSSLQSRYHARDCLRGKTVICSDGKKEIIGIAQGVDAEGVLLVQTPDGHIQKINSSEISVKPNI